MNDQLISNIVNFISEQRFSRIGRGDRNRSLAREKMKKQIRDRMERNPTPQRPPIGSGLKKEDPNKNRKPGEAKIPDLLQRPRPSYPMPRPPVRPMPRPGMPGRPPGGARPIPMPNPGGGRPGGVRPPGAYPGPIPMPNPGGGSRGVIEPKPGKLPLPGGRKPGVIQPKPNLPDAPFGGSGIRPYGRPPARAMTGVELLMRGR